MTTRIVHMSGMKPCIWYCEKRPTCRLYKSTAGVKSMYMTLMSRLGLSEPLFRGGVS
jgi:hypothetical protein